MKRFYKLLVMTSVLTVSGNAATKLVKHTVKSGDTLSQIAVKHDTTVASIRKENHIKEGQALKLGKVLSVLATVKYIEHKIASGDTLLALAIKNNTTVASIMEENSIKKDKTLKLGAMIKIPTEDINAKENSVVKKIALAKTINHTVKGGDTLLALAIKNDTSLTSIMKANDMTGDQTLKLGQVIKIPNSAKTTKIAKKVKVNKSKKTVLAKVKKKKHIKVAYKRTTTKEKQLAKTLRSVKFKKANTKKTSSKRSNKFALSDIIFNAGNSKKSNKMINLAKKKLGRKYVWGAVGNKNTFDCSGLTTYVCKKNGIKIPRRAIEQSKHGKRVSRSNLKPGDLVFFDTSKKHKGYVNHVGIYIGNNNFIHASSAKKKVVITSLNKPFYSNRFKVARRVASL